MPFTPSTAAQNTAALAGDNMANLAAPLTAMQSSISGGNLAPSALMDAILSSVGYQAQSDAASLGTTSTSSTSFVDVGNGSSTGFSSWTFSVPVTKTYLVHIDLSAYQNTAGQRITFQLLVDGSAVAGQPTSAASLFFNQTSVHTRYSWRVPAAMTAGSRVLKLQWKVDGGVGNVDVNDFRCFTVTG